MGNNLPSSQGQHENNTPTAQPLAFAQLIRLFNQSGTILLLFPTLWSLFLASRGWPNFDLLLIFILGSFLMRSAGVIMNDLADQRFDRQVQRTRHRPLASGQLTSRQALGFLSVLLLLAASLLWLLTPLAILLSPIALLLAGMYPFCKRVMHIPQLVLGVAFGWGGVMAWAAVENSLSPSAWCLFGATICWAIAYDTIYAIQDMEDDRKIGVKSSALLFGHHTWLGVGIAAAGMLLFLSFVGQLNQLTIVYWLAVSGVALILAYQITVIRDSISPEKAFALFKQHSWVGALILMGIGGGQ